MSAILLALVPLVAVACLLLNLLIRAKGNRTLSLKIKALGVEINIESFATKRGGDHEGS